MKEYIIPFVFCISAKCDKVDFYVKTFWGKLRLSDGIKKKSCLSVNQLIDLRLLNVN